jgi:hypothetical protein
MSQIVLLFKIANKICKKKTPHWISKKKKQNEYLIGLAKKKKKPTCNGTF